MLQTNRRRTHRAATNGVGILSWSDRGLRHNETVRVMNASDGGLQVKLAKKVPLGALVRISGETVECLGYVRYSRPIGPMGLDFVSGIEFCQQPVARDAPDLWDARDKPAGRSCDDLYGPRYP